MAGRKKRLFLPIMLIICSLSVFAQPTQEEKKLLFEKIDTLLINYVKYSRFLEGVNDKITPAAINNFRELFESENVMLPDEMSPAYFDKGKVRLQIPSYNGMDREALKLQDSAAAFKDTNSISEMDRLKNSLNRYFTGLENGRSVFFGEYDKLNRNIEVYKSDLLTQEKIVSRSLGDFIVLMEANYPEGLSVKLLNSVVSFKGIEKNEVKLMIEKKTDGKLYLSSVKLQNIDTLVLTLRVSNNYSKVQISNIEMIGYKLSFLNDKDHDFVSDAEDACIDEKGLFQITGCPPEGAKNFVGKMNAYISNRASDSALAVKSLSLVLPKITVLATRKARLDNLINTPPRWMLVLGANAGAATASLTNNSTNGYSSPIKSRELNAISNFSGGKSFGGFLMLERYFGIKSNFGVGAGLAFNLISGTIKKDSFRVAYKQQDKRDDFFTQIIRADGLIEEKVSFSSFSVPITGIYKWNLTPAIGLKIEAGIALNLYNSAKMKSNNGNFDYEAIYKLNNQSPKDYFDPGDPQTGAFDKSSWLLTNNHVSAHTVNPGDYFTKMSAGNEFYVWQNDNPTQGNTRSNFNLGVSFFFRPSIAINFNKGATLNLGVFYTSTSFSQSNDNYKMIDIAGGSNGGRRTYNTMMDGVSKMSMSNFGIHISYSYSLFYYLSKWTKELSGLR